MATTETITVTGQSRRRVFPDVAVWSAAVEGRADTQRAAFGSCSIALAALVTAIRDAATPAAEIAAGGVYVGPEWDERGRKRIGFVAAASVTIRASIDEAARLGQAALDAGAARLDGPTFEIGDPQALRDELRAEAVTAARVTATRMADAAERRPGRVISISDASDQFTPGWGPPVRYARSAAIEMQVDAPPLEPGAQEVTAAVTVTYELLD